MKLQLHESSDTLPDKGGCNDLTSREVSTPLPDQNLSRSEFCTFEHMPKYIFREQKAPKLDIEKSLIKLEKAYLEKPGPQSNESSID